MKKLNKTMYRKLEAQAQEAKEHGLVKLADSITGAIGSEPSETIEEYSYKQMQADIHSHLWKIATHVLKYYDLNSADVIKLDRSLVVLASELTNEIEHTLGVSDMVKGPFEPKLPGENK